MTTYNSRFLTSDHSNRHLFIAFLVSFLIHLLLLLIFQIDAKILPAKPIEVTLLNREVKNQIVSPSELPESKPLETTKLSDKDTRAETEQLRRGDFPQQPSPVQTAKPARQAVPPPQKKLEQQTKSEVSPPTALKLRDDQLLGKFAREIPSIKPAETKLTPDEQRQKQFQQLQPFQRAEGSIFSQGNPDLLPDIRDGDLTFLNAKADRNAVFVRRVALQVFGILRSLSWQELNRGQLEMLQGDTIIEAVMDPSGKLISVTLQGPSGSAAFDSIVKKATKEGTSDQNPPQSAQAADGNIHFIFYSKSWSRVSGDSFREQRWIMLGTGLL